MIIPIRVNVEPTGNDMIDLIILGLLLFQLILLLALLCYYRKL